MTNAYLYRMPAGVPGDITRKNSAVVEPNIIDSGVPPTVYGNAVKMVGGYIRPVPAGAAAADVYGILVRPYPTNSTQDPLGTSTPPTSGPCDVLKSGYINALLNNSGTNQSAKNGAVYIRVASAASGKPIGGFEAASDGGNTIIMANSYFMGPADADGNVEIAYNL